MRSQAQGMPQRAHSVFKICCGQLRRTEYLQGFHVIGSFLQYLLEQVRRPLQVAAIQAGVCGLAPLRKLRGNR
jgi:hypothetical protein